MCACVRARVSVNDQIHILKRKLDTVRSLHGEASCFMHSEDEQWYLDLEVKMMTSGWTFRQ